MGRIIVGTALAGWAAIVGIAWHLADKRIEQCGRYIPDRDCVIRLTTQRDYVLSVGLTVALAFVVAALCVFAIIKARQGVRPIEPVKVWRPATPEPQARLS